MVIKRLGAQRFSGLEADVSSLPIDADLVGAIFNSTDTLKFFIFNGTVWNESAGGGGGITGLEPNSTILEFSTDILDYTTPSSATATSSNGAQTPDLAIDGLTATFWESNAGINESITLDMGSKVNMYGLSYFIEKAGFTETQFQIKTPAQGFADAVWGFLGDQVIENYTTYADQGEADALWVTTDIATQRVNIATNVLDFDESGSSIDDIVSYDVGTANISDTEFIYRFKWDLTSFTQQTTGGNVAKIELGLTENLNIGENPVSDLIGLSIENSAGGNNVQFKGLVKNGATKVLATLLDTTTPLLTYFFEIKRISATSCEMRMFSDSNYSVQIGVTATPAITSATAGLQFFSQHLFAQSSNGVMIGTIDDIELFNNVSVAPAVTSPEQILRTIEVADLAEGQNFIRFNGVNSQFLEIRGSSGSSLVMKANELAVQLEADPPLTTKHGQFTINPTNTSLPLNGGDPTSSVIEDPVTNSMTLVSAVEQSDPPTDGMVMWNEILDANNSVSHSKMKIDGVIKNVRWF